MRPSFATPLRFATVGDDCIDRYLSLKQAAVGGNAVNVAVQLSTGAKVQLFWRSGA